MCARVRLLSHSQIQSELQANHRLVERWIDTDIYPFLAYYTYEQLIHLIQLNIYRTQKPMQTECYMYMYCLYMCIWTCQVLILILTVYIVCYDATQFICVECPSTQQIIINMRKRTFLRQHFIHDNSIYTGISMRFTIIYVQN